MSTEKLFDSLWGESGYCTLLLGPGYSEAAALRAMEALEGVVPGPMIESEVVRATWLLRMVQIIKGVISREAPQGMERSSAISHRIRQILGACTKELNEVSDEGFRARVARADFHWDLEQGFLGILRRFKFSDSAFQVFLQDLDEWAGLYREFDLLPRAFVSELWHVPEYVFYIGPRALERRLELQRLIVTRIAAIFGEPAPGVVERYLSNPEDFEHDSE